MRKIWTIARHEYLVNVRRPGFIIMTALVPLLGALVLLAASFFGGQASAFFERQFTPEPKQIGVVDQLGDFTPILPAYRERYQLFADEEVGRAALQLAEIATLMVIPQDYVDFSEAVRVDSASMRAFFVDHLVRDEVSPALRQRLTDPIEPVFLSLETEGQPQGGPLNSVLNFVVPYFLGLLLVMSILVSSGYLLRGVAEEKTSRIIEIVLSSVTASELLAGKVLGLGALGLTQVAVWLASSLGLSGGAVNLLGVAAPVLAWPEVFVLGLVYYLLGFLVYAVLMGAAGALGTTMQESQQLAGIFSM